MGLTFNPFTGTFDFTGSSGGGGGTIGGSIAASQVAFGSGADTITGSNAFTWVDPTLNFASGKGVSFDGPGAPTTIIGGDDGAGDTMLIVNNTDAYIPIDFPQYADWFFDGGYGIWGQNAVTMEFSTTNIFAAMSEVGTPGAGTVVAFRLGGDTPADDMLVLQDAQPGDDETAGSRAVIIYARAAEATNVVAHTSIFLSGNYYTGGASHQRAIELENKVNATTGAAEFWLEEVVDPGGGFPFMRFFRTNTGDGTITAHTNSGDTLNLGAWDTDDNVNRSFLQVASGNTPSLTIAPPSGGTVSVEANTLIFDSYLQTSETSAPSAPAANGVRLFAQDNGAGKTQLMVLFSSGVAQQLAVQA